MRIISFLIRRPLLFLAAILLIYSLTACTTLNFELGWAKPSSLLMKTPPAGPPEYQQGYIDGCETGYSGYGNQFNKQFHTWKQDPILAQNQVYYQVWKDAYAYCALYGMMTDEHGLGNWR